MIPRLARILLVLLIAAGVAAAALEIVRGHKIRLENDLWTYRHDEAFGAGAGERGLRRALAHLATAPPAMKVEHDASVRVLIDALEAAAKRTTREDLIVFRFELARIPETKSQVLLAARTLQYPRHFEPEIFLRESLKRGDRSLDARTWIIDLRPDAPIEAAEYWTTEAAGKGWRLLHWAGEGR